MEKRNSIFIVLELIVVSTISQFSFSQTTDTLKLNEVNISPRLTDFSATQNIRKTDSIFLNANSGNNLGQLLQNDNSIFVKSYGPSSVTSTSIRGGNASQTAVTWNGFNIKNAMLGENDLSILNTFMTDEVSVQYGGSTAMWGSGAVAGAIHLRNEIKFDRGTETNLMFNAGSFQNTSFGLKVGYSDKRFSTSTRLFEKTGINNFPFNDADGKNKNLDHAQYAQYGILHEDHLKIKTNQLLSFRYWAGLTERNLPPTLSQNISRSSQKDDFNRISLEWQFTKTNFKLQLRNGFFAERLNYTDSIAAFYSHALCVSNITEAEFLYSKNKQHKFQGGINNTNSTARTEDYISKVNQNYLSFFGGYMLQSKNEKHALTINVREEFTRNKFQPFTASVAFVSKFYNWIELKGSANKLYRLPTLNNLYWNPGGNPNLLPESGYSEDFSIKGKGRVRGTSDSSWNFLFESQATIFSRQMNNWIIWLPGSNGIWTPQNLMQVWSRGMETNSSVVFSFKKFTAKVFVNTNYILSTNQKSKTENDASLGRQLIYTPMYSGIAGLQIKYAKFYFSYSHTYTGYRYLTSDNYSYLTPYDLGNFLAGYRFALKEMSLDVNFQINNAWNTNYMIMAQRPMPLSNYTIGIKVNFIKPKK